MCSSNVGTASIALLKYGWAWCFVVKGINDGGARSVPSSPFAFNKTKINSNRLIWW